MLRVVGSVVDVLLGDWYPTVQPQVWMTCTACNTPHISRQQCCDAILRNPSIIYCQNAKLDIQVKEIAPDLAVVDLLDSYLIQENDLEFVENEAKNDENMEDKRKVLGLGAFGVVYMAKMRNRNNRLVAVKEIIEAHSKEMEFSEFQQELWMMRYLFLFFVQIFLSYFFPLFMLFCFFHFFQYFFTLFQLEFLRFFFSLCYFFPFFF